MSEKEAHDFLISMQRDPKHNEVSSGGFIFGILVDPANAATHFRNLSVAQTDGWYTALTNMNMILLEFFYKLKPAARAQISFFFKEAIKQNVPKIDNVLTNLLKAVNEGVEYAETCQILHEVADTLNAHKDWMSGLKPNCIFPGVALLCFSRFISDQTQFSNQGNDRFKQSLIAVCEFLLKERFVDMIPFLGRDLVLVLMRLSKVPPLIPFWKNLLHNPAKLAPTIPQFDGIPYLMRTPCAGPALTYRASMHILRKIDLILKLKPGSHTRHFEWFAKQHLGGHDNGSLRAEIIRSVWHNIFTPEYQQPTAVEMRTQFLVWLLKSSRQGAEQQWCKLMLFWEWFCFDPTIPGSHVFIEPAFSVIRNLLQTQPALANSLFDYLIRMTSMLYPQMTTSFVNSITSAFKALGTVGMPITNVIDSSKVERSLRDSLRDTYPDLYPKRAAQQVAPQPQQQQPLPRTEPEPATNNHVAPPPTVIDLLDDSSDEPKPSTSTEATTERPKPKLKRKVSEESAGKAEKLKPRKRRKSSRAEESTQARVVCERRSSAAIEEYAQHEFEKLKDVLPMVREEFREHLEALSKAVQAAEDASDHVNSLIMAIFDNEEVLESDQTQAIADCWLKIFAKFLSVRKFYKPRDRSEDGENDAFDNAFYTLFRNLCMTPEGDQTRRPLLHIIADMCETNDCVGYLLLYFIKDGRREDSAEEPVSAYMDLCNTMQVEVMQQVVEDLEHCVLDDHQLFAHLLPFLFASLESHTVGNNDLMKLICSHVDTSQFLDLTGEVIRENIRFFRKDTFPALISASMTWEAVEQVMLWQFIRVAGIRIEWLMGIIPKLNYAKHAEAMTYILLAMRNMDSEPTMALMRHLLTRPSTDLFTVNAIKILVEDDDSLAKVAQMINSIILKCIQNGDLRPVPVPKGQKPPTATKRVVTLEHVYSHLDEFRRHCLMKETKKAEALLSSEPVQAAFAVARRNDKLASLRNQFSELFAVMELFTGDSPTSNRPQRKRRRAADGEGPDDGVRPAVRRKVANLDDSDDER
ncbi:Integrator complex subunit 3 [Aphelenchoides avenae]|nr:Integrator complex subunit 3 [Aphelenchus avenae]